GVIEFTADGSAGPVETANLTGDGGVVEGVGLVAGDHIADVVGVCHRDAGRDRDAFFHVPLPRAGPRGAAPGFERPGESAPGPHCSIYHIAEGAARTPARARRRLDSRSLIIREVVHAQFADVEVLPVLLHEILVDRVID